MLEAKRFEKTSVESKLEQEQSRLDEISGSLEVLQSKLEDELDRLLMAVISWMRSFTYTTAFASCGMRMFLP